MTQQGPGPTRGVRADIGGVACELADGQVVFSGRLRQGDVLLEPEAAARWFADRVAQRGPLPALDQANGAFCYAARSGTRVWFGTDHFGGRPLFYRLGPQPEVCDRPHGPLSLRAGADEALCCLLAAGYTVADETLEPDLRECAPGVAYALDLPSGAVEPHRWYAHDATGSDAASAAELHQLLLQAVPLAAEGILLPLSGGLDSRALLGAALARGLPVRAYSYGVPHNPDIRIAAEVCRRTGTPHAVLPTTPAAAQRCFAPAGLAEMVAAIHLRRSLPEEHDWIALHELPWRAGLVCPGHTGDWVSGAHVDARLASLSREPQLETYLVDLHFGLTACSSGDFHALLRHKVRQSLVEPLEACGGDLVAAAERWNLEHRQRKYIVNSAAKYRALGLEVHLPFYDRELMSCFRRLRLADRLGQRAYLTMLRSCLFVGERACLAEVPNTRRPGLASPALGPEPLRQRAHRWLRAVDPGKHRKRLWPGRLQGYDDAVAVLTQDDRDAFLRRRVGAAFPLLPRCTEIARGAGCVQAALHLAWVQEQRVCQMNVNGLFLCAFLPHILGACERHG